LSELEVRRLAASDAPAVSALLAVDSPDYRRHFQPFSADPTEIASAIGRADKDRYWGLFVDGERLAGLVILRGLDSGFSAPAFGVYVAHERSNRGLGTLALDFAQAWCRLNDYPEIMLTVDAHNTRAREMYERDGFVADGQRSDRGHLIYRKRLAGE
jgi:RimJ/RimL family protein N-acetyltransferase